MWRAFRNPSLLSLALSPTSQTPRSHSQSLYVNSQNPPSPSVACNDNLYQANPKEQTENKQQENIEPSQHQQRSELKKKKEEKVDPRGTRPTIHNRGQRLRGRVEAG